MLINRFMAFFVMLLLAGPLAAQDRAETGGAQTLEDIMARQAAQEVDDAFRRDATGNPDNAAATTDQLGALGGASDAEVWRALRYDSADISVSAGGQVAETLVQSSGMRWVEFREGPLATYGGWALLGTIGALVLFFILRGRIGVDGGMAGRTVQRFKFIERFAHWMLAGSFIVLGLTGLAILFGRLFIVPTFGHEANAAILRFGIFVHNNVSWAFMLALVMIFVMWVWHNIPNRLDLVWFAQAGGIVGSKHPPAKKFNAGQKLIFWSCIVFGGLISVTGLSLIFPFEIPVFAWVFSALNATGLAELFTGAPLPATLTPHAEMQLAQVLHAAFAFVLMAIIIAHIYIGSVGMEGASGAMTHGEVDEAWAKQHHSIWLAELQEKERQPNATPAE